MTSIAPGSQAVDPPRRSRALGVPTVADRVVQAALKLVLEPIFEADFHPVVGKPAADR